MHIPISEQETVIQISRDSDRMKIWTTDTMMMTRLDKLVETSDLYELCREGKMDGEVVDKEYSAPKSMLTFRSKKVTMTEEQRAKNAEKLAKAREKSARSMADDK